jgi:hypothetical protein
MFHRTLKLAPVVALLALPAAVWAQPKTVTATGQSAVVNNDKVRARDKALDDAKRQAVEQAIGTLVSSETVTSNYELISDKVLSKSSGYVRNFKVLSEGVKEGVFEVKIEAEVDSGGLQNDLQGILAVLKAKNMPRVLLMITEQNVGSAAGNSWWAGEKSFSVDLGVVENTFIDQWNPKGFSFVDRQALAGKIKVSGAVTNADQPSDDQAKEFAKGSGAEVVIFGKAIATDAGPIMGSQMHSCRANISLRALNVDSGEILGTSTQEGTAGHIDPPTGGTKALQKVSQKAAEDLLAKIMARWEAQVAGPNKVSLTINGVQKSKHLRDIETFLRNDVRGVQDVRQRGFKAKKAEMEIELKGTAQDLAEELEDKKFPGFNIEVEEITANSVTASVK